jgi:hypothetical protein
VSLEKKISLVKKLKNIMEKNLQKVLQVSFEILFFTNKKIKNHHGKEIYKSSPGEFRNFIFHMSKNFKTSWKINFKKFSR